MMGVVAEHLPRATALAVTNAILAHFAGSQVYFPVAARRALQVREIRERIAAGANLQALAREYGISYSWLVRLLKRG